MAQAEQQHIGLHTREYTHTHKLCGQENSWEKCVCVSESLSLNACICLFTCRTVCLCIILCATVCVRGCVCVLLNLCKYVCGGNEGFVVSLRQTACVSTSVTPPILNPVWRQEVEEVWGGEEIR